MSRFSQTGTVCRCVVWLRCCCDEYTRRVLKSFGRSFLQSHRRSWRREHSWACRVNRMRRWGRRSVNVERNLHAICSVSVNRRWERTLTARVWFCLGSTRYQGLFGLGSFQLRKNKSLGSVLCAQSHLWSISRTFKKPHSTVVVWFGFFMSMGLVLFKFYVCC